MQAANGETKAGAGKKRTLTDREQDEKASNGSTIIMVNKEEEDGGDSSSDTSSETSTSGSSTSTSSGSSTSEEGTMDNLFEEDECGRFFNISCAQNEAKFYLKRFARGSVGKCILFKERWLTPNEFQAISGRKSSKDWKRSIRLRGRCLKEFIAQGLFQEHVKTCICKICSGENVDMLKQEGEMALAVKRRRLSQADSLPPSSEPVSSISQPSSTVPSDTNDATKKGRGRGRGRKTPIKLDPEEKREHSPGPNKIWSPSGEAAPEVVTSNEEDEYKPAQPTTTDNLAPQGVVDSSDFLPRRSRRTTHRKHNGHRTEIGTFTRKPSQWDTEEVAEFLKLQGYGKYADPFSNNEIDGQSLFLLREQHLMDRFQMKLGPALTLIDTISRLRHPPPY